MPIINANLPKSTSRNHVKSVSMMKNEVTPIYWTVVKQRFGSLSRPVTERTMSAKESKKWGNFRCRRRSFARFVPCMADGFCRKRHKNNKIEAARGAAKIVLRLRCGFAAPCEKDFSHRDAKSRRRGEARCGDSTIRAGGWIMPCARWRFFLRELRALRG